MHHAEKISVFFSSIRRTPLTSKLQMVSGVFKLIDFSGKDEKCKHIQGFPVWKLCSVVKLLLQ